MNSCRRGPERTFFSFFIGQFSGASLLNSDRFELIVRQLLSEVWSLQTRGRFRQKAKRRKKLKKTNKQKNPGMLFVEQTLTRIVLDRLG